MNCPREPHVHERGECPCCYEQFDVVFLRPDEEVDCPLCGFKVPVPAFIIDRVRWKLREVRAWLQWAGMQERRVR